MYKVVHACLVLVDEAVHFFLSTLNINIGVENISFFFRSFKAQHLIRLHSFILSGSKLATFLKF